jgi:hypothetical protein
VTPQVRPATLALLRPYPDQRPSMHRVAATIFSALTVSLLLIFRSKGAQHRCRSAGRTGVL